MSLPQMETPSYYVEIPSTQANIKYRPFLVKEEKILLIAMQESDHAVLFNAIKDVIRNCTFNQIEPDNLTTYDVEWLFLNLRIKSKGAEVPLTFVCQNTLEDGTECGCTNTLDFNLEGAKIIGEIVTNKKIILDEATQTGVIMKDPTFDITGDIQADDVEAIYDTFARYIDTVFQGETVYDDFTVKEMQEWIESLTDEQFQKIQEFFHNIPKLRATVHVKCDACGHKEDIVLEGLQSFLG